MRKKIAVLYFPISFFVLFPIISLGQGINITAGGSIVISGNAIIEIANGNLINNGNYTKGTEIVTFSGTTAKTISGSSATDINNLVITNSGGITVEAGTSVTAGNLTTTDGVFELASDASKNASLIVTGTSTGNVTVKRWLTADTWHIASSPVTDQGINSLLSDDANNSIAFKNDNYGVTTYNESVNNWNDYFTAATTGDFQNGTGYLFRRQTTDGTVSFTGALALGDVMVPVTAASATYGWNCVGNPYTSAIGANDGASSASKFLEENSAILDDSYEALYVWNEATNDYVIVNNSGFTNTTGKTSWATNYMQTAQGFIVKAIANGNVVFKPGMQSHQTVAEFKSTEISWPGILLTVERNGEIASTTLAFNDNMSTRLDPGYDAGAFKTGFDVYTKLIEDNGVDFGLQCLPLSELESYTIPVGLDNTMDGEINISLQSINFPADMVPVLFDKLLSSQFAFENANDTYTTQLAAGNGYGRFELQFSNVTGLNDLIQNTSSFKAWYSMGKIIVEGESFGEIEISIYDVQGHKLSASNQRIDNRISINVPEISSGVYLVQVRDSKRIENLKVVKSN